MATIPCYQIRNGNYISFFLPREFTRIIAIAFSSARNIAIAVSSTENRTIEAVVVASPYCCPATASPGKSFTTVFAPAAARALSPLRRHTLEDSHSLHPYL